MSPPGRQAPALGGVLGALALPGWILAVSTLLPLAAFLVTSWLLGWRLQPVLSESMEPAHPKGSLAVVVPIDAGRVLPGTVIAFESADHRGQLVSHRVVEVVERPTGVLFRTQGDANFAPDAELVPARRVRGRVQWSVVGLGSALRWLAWPRAFLLLVVPALTLLVGFEVRDRLRRPAPEAVQPARDPTVLA